MTESGPRLKTPKYRDGKVRLHWSEIGVEKYLVTRSLAKGDQMKILGFTDRTKFDDTTAKPGLGYMYTVAAFDGDKSLGSCSVYYQVPDSPSASPARPVQFAGVQPSGIGKPSGTSSGMTPSGTPSGTYSGMTPSGMAPFGTSSGMTPSVTTPSGTSSVMTPSRMAPSGRTSGAPSGAPSGMAPSGTPSGMAPSGTPSGMAPSGTPSGMAPSGRTPGAPSPQPALSLKLQTPSFTHCSVVLKWNDIGAQNYAITRSAVDGTSLTTIGSTRNTTLSDQNPGSAGSFWQYTVHATVNGTPYTSGVSFKIPSDPSCVPNPTPLEPITQSGSKWIWIAAVIAVAIVIIIVILLIAYSNRKQKKRKVLTIVNQDEPKS